MPTYRHQVDKYLNRPDIYKRQEQLYKNAKARQQSILLRKAIIEARDRQQYTNELERLRGIIENTTLSGKTVESIKKRTEEIKNMRFI